MNKIEFGDPELTRQFGRLRRKYNKYFQNERRFADRKYWAAVLKRYEKLVKAGIVDEVAREIEELLDVAARQDRHPISLIIAASSTSDKDWLNRGTSALLFALHKRDQWDDLLDFFSENGGVRGCAEAYRKYRHQPAPPKSRPLKLQMKKYMERYFESRKRRVLDGHQRPAEAPQQRSEANSNQPRLLASDPRPSSNQPRPGVFLAGSRAAKK
jgi:hypothetical protein